MAQEMAQEGVAVRLAADQVEQGVDLLARVFQDDPMMIYLVANPARVLDKPRRFYRAAIRMGLDYGAVYATPALDGVAVWISPGNTDFSMGQLFRTGFVTAALSMGLKSMGRFMQSADYLEKVKRPVVPEHHWELMFVGVDAAQRGKGIGAKLLAPIMARADAQGEAITLESTNQRNLTFYQRLGFHTVVQGQIPQGGPDIWVMLREPT